jgi:hypothetical protein
MLLHNAACETFSEDAVILVETEFTAHRQERTKEPTLRQVKDRLKANRADAMRKAQANAAKLINRAQI